MDANNVETFFVETGNPQWKSIGDMFNWFDERKDENWIVMHNQIAFKQWPDRRILQTFGMPMNLEAIEIFRSGRIQGDRFKDYICCYLGVRAHIDDNTYGATGINHLYSTPSGHPILIHIWGAILLARDVDASLLMICNFGKVRRNIGRQFDTHSPALPEPHWWTQIENASLFRPDDLIKLAKGFKLLNRDIRLNIKPGRPPWFNSPKDFLIALNQVLSQFKKKPVQLTVMRRLDKHPLCKLVHEHITQSDTSLLREWIKKAGAENIPTFKTFNEAWELFRNPVE